MIHMSTVEKEKFKVAAQMIYSGGIEEYKDYEINSGFYKTKDVCKVVDGTKIIGAIGKLVISTYMTTPIVYRNNIL